MLCQSKSHYIESQQNMRKKGNETIQIWNSKTNKNKKLYENKKLEKQSYIIDFIWIIQNMFCLFQIPVASVVIAKI